MKELRDADGRLTLAGMALRASALPEIIRWFREWVGAGYRLEDVCECLCSLVEQEHTQYQQQPKPLQNNQALR